MAVTPECTFARSEKTKETINFDDDDSASKRRTEQ